MNVTLDGQEYRVGGRIKGAEGMTISGAPGKQGVTLSRRCGAEVWVVFPVERAGKAKSECATT